jgi:hypothetical protein
MSGGKFSITPGATLTLTGALEARPVQLFAGGGAVSFTGNASIPEVYPQWWGAKGDGVVDDAPAFREAVAAITTTGGLIRVPSGLYRLASCDASQITQDEHCAFILKDNMKVIGDGGATGGGTGLTHRPGTYTKNGATASVADGGTITHGLGGRPNGSHRRGVCGRRDRERDRKEFDHVHGGDKKT